MEAGAARPASAPPGFALWAAAGASVALHLWGLYSPDTPVVPDALAVPGLDKVAHVVLFALPAFVLPFVVRPEWLAPVVLLMHAPLSEWLQGTLLARRSGDPADLLADLVGVAVGWLAFLGVRRRRRA